MRTVGVEEELLLVDAGTGTPRAVSARLLTRAAEERLPTGGSGVDGALTGEFQRQQIETNTAPVVNLSDLETELWHWRGAASEAARRAGTRVAAVASSPMPVQPITVASPRYEWMRERYQLTAREHLTCGCHVHVSVESEEEGVAVLDRIRIWLPTLLALSANSPFSAGADTGFASYRSQAMARWPSSGPTDLFGSPEAYHDLVRRMTGSSVLLDPGMLYFDARLSEHLPTVEIRAADVCLRAADTVVVAGLCRALVDTASAEWRAGQGPPPVPGPLLRLATWQAGREGLDGRLLHPHTSRPVPAWSVVERLVDHVRDALEDSGDLARVAEGLARIRAEGNGAALQRDTLTRTGQLIDVVARAVRLTAGQESG